MEYEVSIVNNRIRTLYRVFFFIFIKEDMRPVLERCLNNGIQFGGGFQFPTPRSNSLKEVVTPYR